VIQQGATGWWRMTKDGKEVPYYRGYWHNGKYLGRYNLVEDTWEWFYGESGYGPPLPGIPKGIPEPERPEKIGPPRASEAVVGAAIYRF
jgi:hypothetical protein